MPDEEDSLILEFLAEDNVWKQVWSSASDTFMHASDEFKRVIITIMDSLKTIIKCPGHILTQAY